MGALLGVEAPTDKQQGPSTQLGLLFDVSA